MARGAGKENAMRGDGGQPMSAESRRRSGATTRPRSWLPILLGVAAGLTLCAVAFFALRLATGPAPDPTSTARAICADLTSQRYDDLYTRLTPSLQSQGSEAQFAASQRELDSLLGPVSACQANITSNNGGAASVTLALHRGQAGALNAHLALAETSGHWQITSYDEHV